MLSHSRVRLFVTPWTLACQAPLSMGILQAKILEWVVIPPLQGIFPTQGSSPGLPHCRWILCHLSHQGSLEARGQSLLSQILHVTPTFGSGGSLQ